MEPQIASLLREFEAIRADAESLTAGLSDAQLSWRPHPSRWSIIENLAHLNSIDGQDLPSLFKVITIGKQEGRTASGPFRWSWFERWFIATMEPPFKVIRLRAPRKYQPPASPDPTETMLEFQRVQNDVCYLLSQADGLDLSGIKSASPAATWLKMSLGSRFAVIAAHDRRHLWLARNIRNLPGFPASDVDLDQRRSSSG